ncbi:DSBA-like thioredoxin domain-containing protein [Apiospora sp. TS-2023a]
MTNFTIDITSDPVCPWCYMGKIRLERAISLYQKVYPGGRHDTFRVVWHAFYLEPDAPADTPGVSWAERHAQKFGSRGDGEDEARGRHLREQLAAKGRQHGIELSFWGKIGSTRDAHRLIALAGRREKEEGTDEGTGLQDRVVMQLFRDFFEGEADITSRSMLADVAEQAGMGRRADVLAWLESGEGGSEVDEEARWAREEGQMKGVPRFVVQGKHVIDGAQDEQAFMEAFVKVKKEGEGDLAKCAPSSSVGSDPGAAASCAPGGSCS